MAHHIDINIAVCCFMSIYQY